MVPTHRLDLLPSNTTQTPLMRISSPPLAHDLGPDLRQHVDRGTAFWTTTSTRQIGADAAHARIVR